MTQTYICIHGARHKVIQSNTWQSLGLTEQLSPVICSTIIMCETISLSYLSGDEVRNGSGSYLKIEMPRVSENNGSLWISYQFRRKYKLNITS